MFTKIAAAIVIIGILAYAGIFFLNMRSASSSVPPASAYKTATVTIGTTTIAVKIADTDALREQGLSDTQSLAAGQGMLFVFSTPSVYTFWMKNMNYDLDMIWANATGTIVSITRDAQASSYNAQDPQASQVFAPTSPAQYVIEVPAGYAAEQNIQVGDVMHIGQ